MSDDQEIALKFKPLSEGLGFHPFSNGMPYSPSVQPQKKDLSQGTGAVSAGRPSFAYPKPAVSAPAPTAVVHAPTPAKIIAQTPPVQTAPAQEAFGWDYLGKRFFAFFVDSFINISLGALVLTASLWKEDFSPQLFANLSVFMIMTAFLLFFSWALITAQEVAFGTSIGKKFLGLSIEATAVRTVARAFLFIPSALFMGLGLFWAMIDKDRRGFHDIVSGVQPEENSQRPWER